MSFAKMIMLLIAVIMAIPGLFAATSDSTQPFTITISTQYGTIYSGQEVVVHVVMTNTSNQTFRWYVPARQDIAEVLYTIVVQDSSGKAVPMTAYGQAGTPLTGGSVNIVDIPPGGADEEDAVISNVYALTTPGQYQVQMSTVIPSVSSTVIQSNLLPITITEPAGAVFITPDDYHPRMGLSLSGPSATFTWNAFPNATSYTLLLGSTGNGSSDVYNSGAVTTTTATATKIPTDGRILYATLQTVVNGETQSTNNQFFAYGTPQKATLTAPVPSSQLTSSTATFTWWPGVGVTGYKLLLGSTGIGSSNLGNSYTTKATSYNATKLPMNSTPIYARLYSQIRNVWQYTDYLYTAAAPQQPAALISPTPGPLNNNNPTFTWSAGCGVTAYKLQLGTTGAGSSDLLDTGSITATSYSATNLPSYGATITATLSSQINGAWQANSYNFGETGSPHAVITSPVPGSKLSGSSTTFTWSKGVGVTEYSLSVGSTGANSSDFGSTGPTTATSYTATNIHEYGTRVTATLNSQINGNWVPAYYLYLEDGPYPATMTSPTPSTTTTKSILSGSTVTFTWSTGADVTAYKLLLGTTAGGSDVYNSYTTTATSKTVNNIPTTGATIYATLYTEIGGVWYSNAYTYTAK